jgi:hypothetical protein
VVENYRKGSFVRVLGETLPIDNLKEYFSPVIVDKVHSKIQDIVVFPDQMRSINVLYGRRGETFIEGIL